MAAATAVLYTVFERVGSFARSLSRSV